MKLDIGCYSIKLMWLYVNQDKIIFCFFIEMHDQKMILFLPWGECFLNWIDGYVALAWQLSFSFFVFQQRLGRTCIWPWKPSVFDLRLPGMTHMKKLKDSCDVSKVGWLRRVDIDSYVREREFFPLRRRNTLYDGEIPFKTERYPFGTDGSQISA